MPFDPVIGFDADPQLRSSLFFEGSGSEFVPDIHHIDHDLVLLSDGSVLAMISVPGFPFELESMRARNIRRRQINDLIRGIADDNVTLSIHLAHHDTVPPLKLRRFRSRFTRRLFAKYQQNCLGHLVANEWFITVVVSPRFTQSAPFGARWRCSAVGFY